MKSRGCGGGLYDFNLFYSSFSVTILGDACKNSKSIDPLWSDTQDLRFKSANYYFFLIALGSMTEPPLLSAISMPKIKLRSSPES